jgi:hypothetical protein
LLVSAAYPRAHLMKLAIIAISTAAVIASAPAV